MPDYLSAELKQFINQHIESLAQLEVLLYLRQHGDRPLHSNEIANRLAITLEMSRVILADLARQGFAVQVENRYRYQPASEDLGRLVELLENTYRERRVTVTTHIYSKPLEKMKTFADAFRFRKEQ